MPKQRVTLYFDVISPYAWLGLKGAPAFGREYGIEWTVRPVVYGVLLDASGLVGPAETASKRRYTFQDICRCADLHGYRVTGPPAHPFRSLEALRTVCLFAESPGALDLAVRLADAAWQDGRDVTRIEVLASCVEAGGLDASGLAERIAAPEVKQSLGRFTDEALAAGAFGVPTFVWNDEIFWGHDRMPHLAARIEGRLGSPSDRAEEVLARPRGIDRKTSPARRPTSGE